jgi:hypothetical protein
MVPFILRHEEIEDEAVREVLDAILFEDRIELGRIDWDRNPQLTRRRAVLDGARAREQRGATEDEQEPRVRFQGLTGRCRAAGPTA